MTQGEFRAACWLFLILLVAACSVADAAERTRILPAGNNVPVPNDWLRLVSGSSSIDRPVQMGVTAGANGPIINGNHHVQYRDPHGRLTTVPVKQSITVPKAALATAGRVALRALPLVGLGAAIVQELQYANITPGEEQGEFNKDILSEVEWVYNSAVSGTDCTASGGVGCGTPPAIGTPVAMSEAALTTLLNTLAPPGAACSTGTRVWRPLVTYSSSNNQHGMQTDGSVRRECMSFGAVCGSGGGYCGANGFSSISATGSRVCPQGAAEVGGVCQQYQTVPAMDGDLEAALTAADRNDQQKMTLEELLSANVPVPIPSTAPSALTVDDPEFDTVPQTTTRTYTDAQGNPQTETTVTTQTGTVTGQGTTAGNSTVTTTITTITNVYNNGVLVSSTETDQPQPDFTPEPEPEEEPEDDTFDDSDFPAIPELYEQKYEEGLMGVWESKKGALMSTEFINSASEMFTGVGGSGGTCPSWILDLNFGAAGNFGQGDISPPCWIWSAMGLIFLTTSCFTAWRMIFGG